jgi:hypothetical protein
VDHPNRTPWYLRVVPTTALVLVVLGALVLLVPGVRDQVRLSVSRQSQDVVELYFPAPAADGREQACVRHGSGVRVGFVVVSHLQSDQALRYRVALQPDGRHARPARRAGRIPTRPGTARTVLARLAAARTGGFAVTVSLPARDQDIHVHCAGAAQ